VKVAVCSTSNERAVQAIVDVMLGDEVSQKMRVFAGDMVPAKKPDPAIYLLAAKELGVDAARCITVVDEPSGFPCLSATPCYPLLASTDSRRSSPRLGRSVSALPSARGHVLSAASGLEYLGRRPHKWAQ
jgi:beta-phosphoglucomutase-like phosphatase (HAD superfamily)